MINNTVCSLPCGCVLLLCALSAGCGLMPAKEHKPEPAVARVLPPPTPRTEGAIYQAGQQMELFADLKARRVGDVLTIVLNEATNASKSAMTKTAKTTARQQHRTHDLRQDHHHQGRADPEHYAERGR